MISDTFVLLLMTGLLSLVTARPFVSRYYQEEADKQGFRTFFPQQQGEDNANAEIYFPSWSIPQEQSNRAEKQWGISVDFAKQQSPHPMMPYQNRAKGEGFRVSIPQQLIAEEEGRRINFPQEQGIRVSIPQQLIAEEEGRRINFPQEQGYTINLPFTNAKQEGIRIRIPENQESTGKQQSVRYPWQYLGKDQGIRFNLPMKQDTEANEEGITWSFPQEERSAAEEQGIRIPYQQKRGEKQGITFSYPQQQMSLAKEQGFHVPYQQKRGREQGITFSYPQQQMSSAKEQGSGLKTFARNIGSALCKAANGNGQVSEVAAQIQMDQDTVQKAVDFLKQFGRNLCKLITGDSVEAAKEGAE